VPGQRLAVPMVPDGVVYRVLDNLLILDGERLSYRSLDVEQIGSVYETVMGFRLEKAVGPSIAVKATKPHGPPVTVNLTDLLALPAEQRGKRLKELTDQSPTPAALNALKAARKPEDVVAALDRKVAREATPNIVPKDSMVLQPSDERRRSGSHYTPRSLTGPIVRKALEPVLKRLGEKPTPEQILDLKVCDPAMGSGAFLVEACRQLGEVLVKAYAHHERVIRLEPDETLELYAMRQVAQRCLYGVDKNPLAVDLGKLSLWLATLAKDHPFTFLDHSLRCGDSLVGLGKEEIRRFHWKPGVKQMLTGQEMVDERLRAATKFRQEILEGGDYMTPLQKSEKLALAEESLGLLRFTGNLVVVAFFSADNDKKRQAKRDDLLGQLTEYLKSHNLALRPTAAEKALLTGPKGIRPFHWEIEFPEVFGRENGGFDAMVGNPPFLRGKGVSGAFGDSYRAWLSLVFAEMKGNADLVASFFRRTFDLVRSRGCFGMIATNTISQGDTRQSGLKWICNYGGNIFAAVRRLPWPGLASVIVSVVHIQKGSHEEQRQLDGRPVSHISAYLVDSASSDDPPVLVANRKKCFQGSIILGMGFSFDDNDKKGVANPLSLMKSILERHPPSKECIFPYIGSEEVNNDPRHRHNRFVIDFDDRDLESARCYPDLFRIVEEKVKPERMKLDGSYKKFWWLFGRHSLDGRAAAKKLKCVLVTTCSATPHLSFAFLPKGMVYANSLDVFAFESLSAFCTLQSRPHEVWARFFTSSFKDDLRYAPTDCFETFPFPENSETHAKLEAVGKEYYEFRAALMVKNNEGLTKTYNLFHDPNEKSPDILRLRELHAAMDRAVLDAYGWTDLQPTCDFLLDYVEEEEENEGGGKAKKKPYRYRWPDDFRDEVLARLLALNAERAQQEALAGSKAAAIPKRSSRKRGGTQGPNFPGIS